jgi:hypothetical protein
MDKDARIVRVNPVKSIGITGPRRVTGVLFYTRNGGIRTPGKVAQP